MDDSIYNKSLDEIMRGKREHHLERIRFHENEIKIIDSYFSKGNESEESEVTSSKDSIDPVNWRSFCIETIKDAGELMTASQIYKSYDTKLTDKVELRAKTNGVSLILSELSESGALIKTKERYNRIGYYYGLPEMFRNGKPIKPLRK